MFLQFCIWRNIWIEKIIQCIAESFGQNEAAEAAFEAALNTRILWSQNLFLHLKEVNVAGVKIYEDSDSVLCFTKKCFFNTV